jgi:hypothetical protein
MQMCLFKKNVALQDPGEGWLGDVHHFPLHSVLLIIRFGLRSYETKTSKTARNCAESSTQQLLLLSMACLLSGDERVKQATLKGVLPSIMECAARTGSEVHESFLQAIWDCARCDTLL